MISISLSPNTQGDDLLLALKLILQPWKWPSFSGGYGRASKDLEEAFRTYHGVRYAYSFNSGRSALMAILYAFGIGEGDEVIIQAFTCNAVPNPILWMGASPIYADIDDTLNIDPQDLEKKITLRQAQGRHPRAVIVQHTFGVPADMDRILEIARQHNLVVIEDCAHALGATYKGKHVGTLSDASFFSFGRDKVISSVYGGMAATNNPKIAEKIEEFLQKCGHPSNFWIFQQLMHPIIFSIALPFYNFFNIGKILIKEAQKFGMLSLAVTKEEKRGGRPSYFPKRLPEALAELALNQFKKLDLFNAHRQKLAQSYTKNLNASLYKLPAIRADYATRIFLRFPVSHQRRDAILRQARTRGIYLGDWYTNAIAPQDTNLEKMQYIPGSCPRAEAAAEQIFNLPTHINISMEQSEKIVNFLNSSSF